VAATSARTPSPPPPARSPAANYKFSFASGTLTITRRPIAVDFTVANKIWDGNDLAIITGLHSGSTPLR
jgi:hypothetical protein